MLRRTSVKFVGNLNWQCIRNVKGCHLLPLIPEVVEEISVRDILCDETEGLLDGDAADQVDNVIVVAFRDLLHHLYLCEEVRSLLPSGRVCSKTRKEYCSRLIQEVSHCTYTCTLIRKSWQSSSVQVQMYHAFVITNVNMSSFLAIYYRP